MAINLTGPMRLTKAVAPIMKAQGRGRIINIASVAGLSPTGSSIAYAVSKAGLIHLTRCMAVALAPETLVFIFTSATSHGRRSWKDRPTAKAIAAAISLLLITGNTSSSSMLRDGPPSMCRSHKTARWVDSRGFVLDAEDDDDR
jgi:NAD(P)-dependent dehydrogenase (short-subunit alcohol dehydrogenase family)